MTTDPLDEDDQVDEGLDADVDLADLSDVDAVDVDAVDDDDDYDSNDADDDPVDESDDDDDEDDESDDDEDDESADEDEDEDDDDEDDEAEESLDVLLAREKVIDEDDIARISDEARGGLTVRAVPVGAGEFTCQSCFLVKRRAQIADDKRMLCFDCV